MKFIIIASVSSILAGMGIGGGALFVILSTMFLKFNQIDAQALNLIMFLFSGISSTIANQKNKIIEKNIVKKIVPLSIIGSIVGVFALRYISKDKIGIYFNIFMILLGLYEIFSSLIRMKKAKNNSEDRKEN